MRDDVVLADAHHADGGVVEIRPGSRKGLALNRAAGRVVLRIEVHNQPLAGEVAELHVLAILIREGELWKRLSCFEHRFFSFR
jgi:hypothetical protein